MKKNFKKIAAVALSCVLTLGMTVNAFADADIDQLDSRTSPTPSPVAGNLINFNSTKTSSRDVMVKVVKANTKVYRVDVEWTDLNFTWTWGSGEGAQWNPDTHQYGDGKGDWDKKTATITVTNHSNDSIGFEAGFKGESSKTTKTTKGVIGTLTDNNGTIVSAVGKNTDSTDITKVISLTIDNKPDVDVEGQFTLGTIDVVIKEGSSSTT